ncbi:MAG: transcriptional repressor [Victivallaceae bacterium]|nr:transcriptional repressor [Victivallaceae bacterium]
MNNELQLTKLRRYFNTSGKRYSIERENMLEVIAGMKGEFTLVELFKAARAKGYVHAVSTLYRNLFVFIDAGFITELRLSGGRTKYVANTGQNGFLLCVGCGKLSRIRLPKGFKAIQDELYKKHEFIPLAYNYQLKGYCSKCRKKIAG